MNSAHCTSEEDVKLYLEPIAQADESASINDRNNYLQILPDSNVCETYLVPICDTQNSSANTVYLQLVSEVHDYNYSQQISQLEQTNQRPITDKQVIYNSLIYTLKEAIPITCYLHLCKKILEKSIVKKFDIFVNKTG